MLGEVIVFKSEIEIKRIIIIWGSEKQKDDCGRINSIANKKYINEGIPGKEKRVNIWKNLENWISEESLNSMRLTANGSFILKS